MTSATSDVRSEQRFKRSRPCPICGGCDGDPRGHERRCHGFLSSDGLYAHCSRDEHAGTLKQSPNSQTYAHRLRGPCACGSTHGASDVSSDSNIEATYDYRDENGALLFQAVRLRPKAFRQRRPDGAGGWHWDLKGTRRVLYRYPELLAAPTGETVFVVEGEKDVDNLRRLGGVATCNPMGAGKWHHVSDCVPRAFAGRRVVVLPDADEPGREHATQVAQSLTPVASNVRVVELPARNGSPIKDVSDWLAAGGTFEELQQIATSAEPGETAGAAPGDAFADEIKTALVDVSNALGSSVTAHRHPLFFDAGDLFRRDFPSTAWLVTGLITRGGLVQFGAEPKSGKTWLALEIAVAITTGTRALGDAYAARGVVAYFFAEDLDRQVRNRIRALLAGRNLGPPALGGRLHVCPRGKTLDITRDEDLAWVVASARRLGQLDLLVLDPLRDIHSGKENESDDMANVMRRMKVLGEVLGCTVGFAHHTAKASKESGDRRAGQRARGSGAIHGSTDSGIYFGLRGGDGKNVLDIGVEVEIKGAGGMGRFAARLAIEDDDEQEARQATWAVMRYEPEAEGDTEGQDAKDDDAVVSRVRELANDGHPPISKSALRDMVPGVGDHRVRRSLARLLGKRLALRDVEHEGKTLRDRVVLV